MSRYIDADNFERACMSDKNCEDMQDVIYKLRDYPTADVELVRHGHWECSDDIYETAICSECGCDTEESYGFVINSDEYNFCRNCGAKMDEWEQDHEVQKV